VLGQFHLKPAFVGAGAPGENIQNQGGTVDDLNTQGVFQVLLLDGFKLVIENDNIIVLGVF
jgi:hypothetical protein